MAYTIRHCAGNRSAWGVYNDSRDSSDYGWCLMTSMSLDSLVSRLIQAFAAPVGDGHIKPQAIRLEL